MDLISNQKAKQKKKKKNQQIQKIRRTTPRIVIIMPWTNTPATNKRINNNPMAYMNIAHLDHKVNDSLTMNTGLLLINEKHISIQTAKIEKIRKIWVVKMNMKYKKESKLKKWRKENNNM